jgi:hypothetical protein
MRTRRHPLSGALYDVGEDGLVRVESEGQVGWFTPDGAWVRGDLHEADAHLCGWLAGPQVPASMARNPKDLHTVVVNEQREHAS